jgi:putative MATE family efflux protein
MNLSGLRFKDLLIFSLPSMISAVIEPIAGIVDTALVGHYNTLSLASLALAVALLSTFTWMFNFVVQASTQAMANGQNLQNPLKLQERVKISLLTALIVGVISSLFLYFSAKPLFYFSGGSESLFDDFWSYYKVRVYGHTFTILAVTCLSLLRGLSRLKLVLVFMAISSVVNILSSWLLLYHFNLGLQAVATGTTLSYIIVFIGGLFFLVKDKRVGYSFFTVKVQKKNWLEFSNNSFSLLVRSFFLSGSFFLMIKFAGRLGPETLAAHQIILQIWLFLSFFLDGLALSASILGGKYFFLGYIKRTKIIFRQLTLISGFIGITSTLLFFFFSDFIISVFTNDGEVKLIILKVWSIIISSMLINALAYMCDGFLFGIEAFRFVRKHMAIACLFLFLPLASLSMYFNELVWVWLGMAMVSLYRVTSSFIHMRKVLS